MQQEKQRSRGGLSVYGEPAWKWKLGIIQAFLWNLGLAFTTLIFELQVSNQLLQRGLSD